jgi:tetratricopeptide (TPR) repeat protein
MIMPETDAQEMPVSEGEQLAKAFLALVQVGMTQKRATPVALRKRAEALHSDALDAPTDEEEYGLLVEAIRADPGSAAVLLELREYFDLTLEEDLEAMRGIVALAERRLGKKVFAENAGHFWNTLETRPYMCASGELAELLLESGRKDEAAAEWEALLALNTNDNQGFRYLLLPFYLERAQLDQADALFSAYPEEDKLVVTFAWCRVLEGLLRQDKARAVQALAVARGQNGFAEAYILGHRRLPKDFPEHYAPGTREEAESYAPELRSAWAAHPEALKWLGSQPKPRK